MFGQIARRYDLLNRLLSLGIDRSWRRRLVRLVPPSDGPILDVCTGTADLALAYARASDGSCSIVGADFCRPMLAIGNQKIRRTKAHERVKLIEADALRLPFPDGHFQVVCVAFGLRNMSDTDSGLREMVRVCRSGGRVAILEFSLPKGRLPRRLYRFYFNYLLPRVGQMVARSPERAYNYLPASVEAFPQDEALGARMRQAGLHSVEYYPFTLGIATLYVGQK